MPDSKKHQKNCGDSIKDRGFHALPPEIMTEVYYCACDQARHDSLQLRVLGFGLLQDGDVGVGVFPEEELTSSRLFEASSYLSHRIEPIARPLPSRLFSVA